MTALGYHKVGRAITKWGAIEKSQMLLLKYWKNIQSYTKYFVNSIYYSDGGGCMRSI